MEHLTDDGRGGPNGSRGMGDNSAAYGLDFPDIETWLNPAVLRDQLELDYADHVKRRDELLAAVDRFWETVKTISSDEEQARASDFVGQLKHLVKAVEADRVREVRVYRDALETMQKFFKAETTDLVSAAARDIEERMTLYARAKEAAGRRALEEQRRAAAAEAEAARLKAEASMRPAELTQAAKVAGRAEKAEHKAKTATAADLGRVRGDLGTVATLQERWEAEMLDLSQVPAEYTLTTLNVSKVQAAINAGLRDGPDGAPAIPGLRIVDVSTVRVRS